MLPVTGSVEANRSEKRWQIVWTHKAHPDWSLRKVGKAVGADHKTVKLWVGVHERSRDVKDQARPGRKALISQAALCKVRSVAVQKQSRSKFSAARLSKVLQAECGTKASVRSVQRTLKAAGWKYGYAKKILMLTAAHKAKRLEWARRHLSKRTAFASWMFTDSKVFLLHRTAGKAGVKMWYPQDCRPTTAIAKRSKGVHVYLGVTKYGVTAPVFVTGGGSQKSQHTNPKTGKAFTGVGAPEYQMDVLPKLIQGGDMLFAPNSRWAAEWIFQQDNARPHTAASTKAVLQKLMPHRVAEKWPALSPDLSWIENMWAWAERQLHTSYPHVQTIPQLKAAIIDIFKNVPPHMLQNHVRGMPGRLQKVVQQKGAHIG